MSKSKDKTALRLLDKYAESYNLLYTENNKLKEKLLDQEKTLSINKNLIKELIDNKASHLNKTMIPLKEENEKLIKEKINLEKEILLLNNKIFKLENTLMRNDYTNKERDIEDKLFIMENKLTEVSNSIKHIKNLYNSLKKHLKNSFTSRVNVEIFDSPPNEAILVLNNTNNYLIKENTILKEKLSLAQKSKSDYEAVNYDLNEENMKLKELFSECSFKTLLILHSYYVLYSHFPHKYPDTS